MIARLAWGYVPSEENNKVFGRAYLSWREMPRNVQLMVKDSKKYAATGGWGFAQFKDGKPDPAAALKSASRATSRLRLATLYSPASHPDAKANTLVQLLLFQASDVIARIEKARRSPSR